MKRLLKNRDKNLEENLVKAELVDCLKKYRGCFTNIDNESNDISDRDGNKMVMIYSKFKLDRNTETDEQWRKVLEDFSKIRDMKDIVNLIGQTNLLSEMSDYAGENISLSDLEDFYSEFETSYAIFEIEARAYTKE